MKLQLDCCKIYLTMENPLQYYITPKYNLLFLNTGLTFYVNTGIQLSLNKLLSMNKGLTFYVPNLMNMLKTLSLNSLKCSLFNSR